VRLRRSSEWGGRTHPPLHRASAPKTLVCSACLAVRPFASSLYRFQVCYLAVGLIYPPLRLRLCLGFWSLLARCSSPHPRSAFHFRFLVHSCSIRLRGPASVQLSLARYLPAGWHPFYACACFWSGAWVSRTSRGCASFVFRISLPISRLLALKFKCACTRLLFLFFRLAEFFLPFPMQRDTASLSRPRRAGVFPLRRW